MRNHLDRHASPAHASAGFLTVDYVAGLLKLNQQTVRNMIDRGELAAVRVGARRVRVRRSELDRFIAAGETVKRDTIDLGELDGPGDVARAFAAAMVAATASTEGATDREELVRVLERLAAATQALADAIKTGAADD